MVPGVTCPQTSSKRNDRAHSNSVIPAALEAVSKRLARVDGRGEV